MSSVKKKYIILPSTSVAEYSPHHINMSEIQNNF